MCEIWETAEFKKKISTLPEAMRANFVEFVRDMYDRESEMMLSFIGESRRAMLGAADDLAEEQEDLRRCATRLANSRMEGDAYIVRPYTRASGRDSVATTISYESEDREHVNRYLRNRERNRKSHHMRSPSSPDSMGSIISTSSSEILPPTPPPTVHKQRHAPPPPKAQPPPSQQQQPPPQKQPSTSKPERRSRMKADPQQELAPPEATQVPKRSPRSPADLSPGLLGPRSDTTLSVVPGTPEPGSVIFVEESEEIMKDLAQVSNKQENERERQLEAVMRMKEKRRKKKEAREELATELLELANEVEQQQIKDKERQAEKLRERLEEKKRKKKEKKEKKDKKKKKESDEGDDPEAEADAEDEKKKKKESKKKKKDKKKKDKDGDVAIEVEA